MKKILNFWLLAGLTLGISLSVFSCKDDDDDNNNQSKTEREEDSRLNTDEGQAATRIFSALANVSELPEDWRTQTFQPDFGTVSEQNALRRIVVVADIDEAEVKFASLADCDPTTLGQTYTANFDDMGSLTWDRTDGEEQLAIVSVNIKQMPGLKEIIYCTEDQSGKNGLIFKVKGTTFYQFGDIIKDTQGYYWVCVRPAFEENNKEDSHWINIINADYKPMPENNLETKWDKGKWKSSVQTLVLPTKLGNSYEHNYNLGQLIYALLDPERYEKAAANDSGKGLGRFAYSHNNKDFVQYVSDIWENEGYFKLFFGKSRAELQKLTGLRFYYNGYSWGMFAGNNASLWMHEHTNYYTGQPKGSESKEIVKYDMTKGFDIRRYTGEKTAEVAHEQFADNYGHYVIRYAKGKTLCTVGTYDYTRTIGGTSPIYRFYDKMDIDAGMELEKAEEKATSLMNAAIDPSKAKVGSIATFQAHIWNTYAAAKNAGEEAVAVIVHIANSAAPQELYNETGMVGNHLAICINQACGEDQKYEVVWGPDGKSGVSTLDNNSTTFQKTAEGLVDGRKNTNIMKDKMDYTAAQSCLNFETWRYDDAYEHPGSWLSTFFLPSVGQYILMLKGLGVYDKTGNGEVVVNAINNLYAGGNSLHPFPTDGTPVWTSTEASDTEAYVFIVDKDKGARFEPRKKSEKHRVYPFVLVSNLDQYTN